LGGLRFFEGHCFHYILAVWEGFGWADAELGEEDFEGGFGLGDDAATEVSAVGGGEDDIHGIPGAQFGEDFLRRASKAGVVEVKFEGLEHHQAEKAQEDMGMNARLCFVEDGANGEGRFKFAERVLDAGQLNVGAPELVGRELTAEMGAQQIVTGGAFGPGRAVGTFAGPREVETAAAGKFLDADIEQSRGAAVGLEQRAQPLAEFKPIAKRSAGVASIAARISGFSRS